jgi:hypothetical protein
VLVRRVPRNAGQSIGNWRGSFGLHELTTCSEPLATELYPIPEFRKLMWVAGDSDNPEVASAKWLAAYVRQWMANTLSDCGQLSLPSVATVLPEACCWFALWKEKHHGARIVECISAVHLRVGAAGITWCGAGLEKALLLASTHPEDRSVYIPYTFIQIQ